jgi:hypothetical protein
VLSLTIGAGGVDMIMLGVGSLVLGLSIGSCNLLFLFPMFVI